MTLTNWQNDRRLTTVSVTVASRWLGLLSLVVLLGGALMANPVWADDQAAKSWLDFGVEIHKFDVAENAARFVFDEAPVFEDGLPAYGNPFITEGYIYPYGFLDDREGVLANGEPAFPDEVIGRWTCRGWLVGDGVRTETGPWVITTQLYDFGDRAGQVTLITDGYELVDIDTPVKRSITGGTGPFRNARGEGNQVLLGFNKAEGVNLRFKLKVKVW